MARFLCSVQSATQAILCIANADEENADRLAVGTVLIARTKNLPLAGWSITVVTLTDYVVTQRFLNESARSPPLLARAFDPIDAALLAPITRNRLE